eukprot:jgi/Galph1/2949/GphlegSOOS_G1619.1
MPKKRMRYLNKSHSIAEMASYFDDHGLTFEAQPTTTNEDSEQEFSRQVLELVQMISGFEIQDELEDDNNGRLADLRRNILAMDPSYFGTPPASKKALEKLESFHFTKTGNSCPVCAEEYQQGDEGKKLPCKHIYHSKCILPWLNQHNTCPLCRYELPTDDPLYEAQKRDKERWQEASATMYS